MMRRPIRRQREIGRRAASVYDRRVSNFPLSYKLSWLPRLINPSLAGREGRFLPGQATLLAQPPAAARRLVFLGDISAVANRETPEVDASLKALIAGADLVVGNCEAPVVAHVRSPVGTAIGIRHAMTPDFLARLLDALGLEPSRLLLSLANNHMLDQGPAGFSETREALRRSGIRVIGAVEDGPLRVVDVGGLAVAFAAFTQWRNAPAGDFAGRVIMLDDFQRDGLPTLAAAKADLRCVVAHWDYEFRHFPHASTEQLAHKIASAAGLIVGHHAHVLQPLARLGDTLVAYGLGDFLGTVLPRAPWPTRLGAILSVEVSVDIETRGRLAGYAVTPFLRERIGQRERLTPLTANEGRLVLRMCERFEMIFPQVPQRVAG